MKILHEYPVAVTNLMLFRSQRVGSDVGFSRDFTLKRTHYQISQDLWMSCQTGTRSHQSFGSWQLWDLYERLPHKLSFFF